MESENIKKDYLDRIDRYEKLGNNVKQVLIDLLKTNNIDILDVSYRVKQFDSFYEKIEFKGYKNPFEEVEDFCGLRIVCYYLSDLKKIDKIITDEFEVKESLDKTGILEPDQFGYRSFHYIVKLKKKWLEVPNYRGLEDLKAEIQIRTVLMHAWADIEHKLAYKAKEQIPEQFRRKLCQLSALLEVADEQFDVLKQEKEKLKHNLITQKLGISEFDTSQPLNLDTLQAFLDFFDPERTKNLSATSDVLGRIQKLGITFDDIKRGYDLALKHIEEIEFDIFGKKRKFAQVGALVAILDIINNLYWDQRKKACINNSWGKAVLKWRDKLNIKNS